METLETSISVLVTLGAALLIVLAGPGRTQLAWRMKTVPVAERRRRS